MRTQPKPPKEFHPFRPPFRLPFSIRKLDTLFTNNHIRSSDHIPPLGIDDDAALQTSQREPGEGPEETRGAHEGGGFLVPGRQDDHAQGPAHHPGGVRTVWPGARGRRRDREALARAHYRCIERTARAWRNAIDRNPTKLNKSHQTKHQTTTPPQLIGWTDDGKQYDKEDAQLVLDRGTPRFYLMRLPKRDDGPHPPLSFDRITYHAQCTQCLGVLQPHSWYMAVARPTLSLDEWPKVEDLAAFEVPHGVYVKMECGTWHAGEKTGQMGENERE